MLGPLVFGEPGEVVLQLLDNGELTEIPIPLGTSGGGYAVSDSGQAGFGLERSGGKPPSASPKSLESRPLRLIGAGTLAPTL